VSRENAEFAEFFAASWDPCVRAVAASTGDMTLAEDQTAEAFARAWTHWHKVSRHPAPRAWVVRTAFNVGASWWHRRSRETALTSHDIAVTDSQGTGLDAAVLVALRRLPARQREVIVLRVFLDLDIDTTATQLGIAPGTVRAHLSRAMAALRREVTSATTTEIKTLNHEEIHR
jgi:RNA polymerase sigma-70 factor (sigma-E family)